MIPYSDLTNPDYYEKCRAAQKDLSRQYLQPRKGASAPQAAIAAPAPLHNVYGIGVDEKYTNGVPTGEACIKILVAKKFPDAQLRPDDRIPPIIDGIPTDVEAVGRILPQLVPNPRLKMRPAQPGSSVGFADNSGFVMAGTFGLLVKDTAGTFYVLSNNHVMANESGIDAGGNAQINLPVGSPIYQPGLLDNGDVATDQIASLTRWVDLQVQGDNLVDGAIAEVLDRTSVSRSILFIGDPNGTGTAQRDMVVQKFGRTTSFRAGRVSSVTFDLIVPYSVGNVFFQDQIAIRGLNGQPFSQGGDSGSAILERSSRMVVGLLFAGSEDNRITFGNHIGDVLTALNVQLA